MSMSSPTPDPAGTASPAPSHEHDAAPVRLSDDAWRERLTPAEFYVLREAGTERAYTGEYWDSTDEGVYACRACGAELFTSREKFAAHCGWPAFYAPLAEDRVRYIEDTTLGMRRVEVRCARCDSHLGHVFEGEGYDTPTDQRYCINSISMTLRPAAQDDAAGDSEKSPRSTDHQEGRA
ncbi:MAG: peptide-methionine (R)-S-oxide reductase MsrB [Micrococcus sp.]|nr:peptide-methionine (R)-S-oxide reductase MsrB [Micrococcus sp.]